jgi:PPOX class probable F420-dependent enzyme
MTVSRSALLKFVDGALTVRLATISRKGTPLLTPLWFARDGDVIYMGTRRSSPHARHITENPDVVMLFGDRGGKPARGVLRVTGKACVCDIKSLSGLRKARLAWRYFLAPGAIRHWMANWRKIGVRNRYYAERTDPAMVEITLGEGEFLAAPHPG